MSPHDYQFDLSANDQRLLDALIDAEFDVESMTDLTPAERERVETLSHLFGLLNDYPVEEADDTLIHATMVGIERHEREAAERMKLDPVSDEGGSLMRGRRLPISELISIAAVILIVVGVGWPIVNRVRDESMAQGCMNNMRMLGGSFHAYATDYNDVLPMATAGMGPGSWDQVRNIINLRPLVEQGYCSHGHLNCPGNHDQNGTSYSYQWQQPALVLHWNQGPTIVILGDRNPLIDATITGNMVPSDSISTNHDGRGQNVLMSDGSIQWLIEPWVGRDNIWLPEGSMFLQTGQEPGEGRDTFLVH